MDLSNQSATVYLYKIYLYQSCSLEKNKNKLILKLIKEKKTNFSEYMKKKFNFHNYIILFRMFFAIAFEWRSIFLATRCKIRKYNKIIV